MKNDEKIILIIEDDADLNELITDRVSESGFSYQSFLKGIDALTWLKTNTPLLMFLDYSLPDFSGKEFILELEAQSINVPPFVVATGRGDELIAVEMMKLGARDYIIKNTGFLDMIGVITKQLSKDIENENKLTKVQNELKDSNEFNRQIVESAKEGIIVYDTELKYMVWNPFMEEITGYKAQDIIGKKIHDVFPDIANKELLENIKNAIIDNTSKIKPIEFFFEFPSTGKSCWVSDVVSPLKNSTGEIIGAISTVRDVTQQKKAEEYLIRSKAALQNLIYSSSELIESSFSEINYVKFSEKILEISGAKYAAFNIFEPDGLSFRTVGFSGLQDFQNIAKKYLHFDAFTKVWKDDVIREQKIKEYTITKFNSLFDLVDHLLPKSVISIINHTFNIGEVYVVRMSKNNIQKGDFTLLFEKGKTLQNPELVEIYSKQVGLFIERHEAELNLKENERKYRVLFADNPQPMFIYDLETLKIIEVNQSTEQHYGYSRNEFLAMTIVDLHLKEDVKGILKIIDRTRKGENTDGISKHIKKNGEEIYVETTAVPSPSFGKNARHVIVNDITYRKLAEDNLNHSLSLLNATLESTADGILVVNLKGIATIYNQKFADMWNIPQRLLTEKNDENILNFVVDQILDPENFRKKVVELYQNPDLTSFDLVQLKDGRTFERLSIPQKVSEKIEGRVWSFRDITERIRAEKEIQQRIDEMTRFHKLTVDRELIMIELKKEINELYKQSGKNEKYRIVE